MSHENPEEVSLALLAHMTHSRSKEIACVGASIKSFLSRFNKGEMKPDLP